MVDLIKEKARESALNTSVEEPQPHTQQSQQTADVPTGLKQEVQKIMSIAEMFGVDKKMIGSTIIKSMVKGNIDLSSMFGQIEKKTKWERRKDALMTLCYILFVLSLFVWTQLYIARWMGFV